MDDINKTIDVGREENYLKDNEVHSPITDDAHSPRDTEDLLTTLRTWGLDLLDGDSPLARLHLEEKRTEAEDLELDLNPTVSQVASDPGPQVGLLKLLHR
jgi:hypothetical protein